MKFTLIPAVFILILGSVHADVAFYAYLSSNIGPIGLDTKVVFNKVLANTYNAYNTETGIFTVPIHGLYEIGINVMEQKGKNVVVGIWVNDKVGYTGTWIQTTPKRDFFIKKSNQIFVHLKAGDQVSLKTRTGGNLKDHYFYGGVVYTNFHAKRL